MTEIARCPGCTVVKGDCAVFREVTNDFSHLLSLPGYKCEDLSTPARGHRFRLDSSINAPPIIEVYRTDEGVFASCVSARDPNGNGVSMVHSGDRKIPSCVRWSVHRSS